MTAEIRTVDWRLPGCGLSCRESRAIAIGILRPFTMILHDPHCHEDYGRALERQMAPGAHLGVVQTGGVGVDHQRLIVTIDGVNCKATPTEVRIMVLLSSQLNRTFSTADIIRAVWDSSYAPTTEGRLAPTDSISAHMLRVNVTRLRQRLGSWRYLLANCKGVGYGLLAEEPTCSSN